MSIVDCGMEAFLSNCRVLQHNGTTVFSIFWPLCSRSGLPMNQLSSLQAYYP